MAKILVKKARKEFIQELGRAVVVSRQRSYFVADPSKDFHIAEGVVLKADLKKKDGSAVKTNTGKQFSVFSSSFIDDFSRIRRLPQVIPLKDIAAIIAETGIGRKSKVLDSGTGSGAVACFIANFAKEVVSYDIKKEHCDIARENAEYLGLKNVTIKNKDVYQGVDEDDADLFILDVPEPWNAIDSVRNALKVGGFVASYSPTIVQSADFADALAKSESFMILKTIEIIERPWEVEARRVRPKTAGIGHSGFITFARKIS